MGHPEGANESWEVRCGGAEAIDLALYVRDALALSVDVQPFVPGLAPSVAVTVPDGVDRAAVTREWPGWWADILAWRCGPGEGSTAEPDMTDRPALRAALAALHEPARDYWRATEQRPAKPTLLLNEVVQDLERDLGRKVKPFLFMITEVRVDEPMWALLTESHALTSQRFVDSEAARPLLREAFLRLA